MDVQDYDGETALIRASWNGRADIVIYLLEAGEQGKGGHS